MYDATFWKQIVFHNYKKKFYLKFYIVYLLFGAFCLRKFVIVISTTKNSYVTYQLET